MNFQMFKLVLEKAEEPEIKLPTFTGSSKKQESSRKTSISALPAMPKPLTVRMTINYGRINLVSSKKKKERNLFSLATEVSRRTQIRLNMYYCPVI